MRKNHKRFIAVILIALVGFGLFNIIIFSTKKPIEVNIWITEANTSEVRLKKAESELMEPRYGNYEKSIKINDNKVFQEMRGFGAALTGSSAWLLHEVLNETEYIRVMEDIFDPIDGIGMSYLRIPIGSSDFSLEFYSYDDTAPDLDDFSINHDLSYIIPVLKDAISFNPNLQIIACPWSAPGWMKIENNLTDPETKGLIGGRLNPDMYDIYADYLILFLKSYEEQGITIQAISLQNEIFYVPEEYPGMAMNVSETIEFAQVLGEKIEEAGLEVELFILEHNWEYYEKVDEILSSDDASSYIDGIAWHGYGETAPEYQSIIHEKYPDKAQFFTEISPLLDYPSFPHNLEWTYHNIYVGSIRNWAESVILWNLVLDQDGGPSLIDSRLRGIVIVPEENQIQSGEVIYEGELYMIGHLSKFIDKGAFRIDSTNYPEILETIAFKNPDGSIAVIVCNPTDNEQDFTLTWDYRNLNYELPARSLATFMF